MGIKQITRKREIRLFPMSVLAVGIVAAIGCGGGSEPDSRDKSDKKVAAAPSNVERGDQSEAPATADPAEEDSEAPSAPLPAADVQEIAQLNYRQAVAATKEAEAAGDTAKVEALYKHRIELASKNPENFLYPMNLNFLARFYMDQENYAAAADHYLQQIKVVGEISGESNPTLVRPLISLARTYTFRKQHESALPVLDRAIQIVEDDPEAKEGATNGLLFMKSRALRALGRMDEAQSIDDQLAASSPAKPEAQTAGEE